jgi:acyl carrier protein
MTTEAAHSLFARLLGRIAPEVDLTDVGDDTLLQDGLDIDSMDFLNLITAVHDETGIEIPERDYPELATIGGFVAYLAKHAPSSSAPE